MKKLTVLDVCALTIEELPKLDLEIELARYLKHAYPPMVSQAESRAEELLVTLRADPKPHLSIGPFFGLPEPDAQWEVQIRTAYATAQLLCGLEDDGETFYAIADLPTARRTRVG